MAPEMQRPKLMIEHTYEFHPLFRSAITPCIKTLSPAVKLIKKAIYGTKVGGEHGVGRKVVLHANPLLAGFGNPLP